MSNANLLSEANLSEPKHGPPGVQGSNRGLIRVYSMLVMLNALAGIIP
jgi:hypothetical protein